MKAVILAAGKGKRMRGLCAALPKPMLPIANRPIIGTTFSRLAGMGVDQVGLVVGYQRKALEQCLGDGAAYGVTITYIHQPRGLGTGHAVGLCEEFVAGEPFALMWGDVLARGENYPLIAKRYRRGDCDAVLTVFRVPDAATTAAVKVADGWVTGIVEKPPPGTARDAFANAGIFIWPARMFDLIRDLERSPRGEYEFTDGISRFLDTGARVAAFELNGYRENVTDPETCIAVNGELLDELLPASGGLIDARARVAGDARLDRVELRAGAVIGKGCTLGPLVSVGEGAEVGPGATVGPNASIGPGCTVGAGATVAQCIMMRGSRLGPGGSLRYAAIAAGTQLGSCQVVHGRAEQVTEVLSGQAPG